MGAGDGQINSPEKDASLRALFTNAPGPWCHPNGEGCDLECVSNANSYEKLMEGMRYYIKNLLRTSPEYADSKYRLYNRGRPESQFRFRDQVAAEATNQNKAAVVEKISKPKMFTTLSLNAPEFVPKASAASSTTGSQSSITSVAGAASLSSNEPTSSTSSAASKKKSDLEYLRPKSKTIRCGPDVTFTAYTPVVDIETCRYILTHARLPPNFELDKHRPERELHTPLDIEIQHDGHAALERIIDGVVGYRKILEGLVDGRVENQVENRVVVPQPQPQPPPANIPFNYYNNRIPNPHQPQPHYYPVMGAMPPMPQMQAMGPVGPVGPVQPMPQMQPMAQMLPMPQMHAVPYYGNHVHMPMYNPQPHPQHPISVAHYQQQFSPVKPRSPVEKHSTPNKRRNEPTSKSCIFCKSIGQPRDMYSSHSVRNPSNGKAICPILRKHKCDKCGATGDIAHSENECPFNLIPKRKVETSSSKPEISRKLSFTSSIEKIDDHNSARFI